MKNCIIILFLSFLFFAPIDPLFAQSSSTAQLSLDQCFKIIAHYEGVRSKVYKCSSGHLTVGVGHKLTEREIALYKDGKGKVSYTDKEISQLFNQDLANAIKSAEKFCGNKKKFDSLPVQIKLILIDMAFNLGECGLNKFVNFKRNLLTNNNLRAAANDLVNSRWYGQVGQRAKDHVAVLIGMSKN